MRLVAANSKAPSDLYIYQLEKQKLNASDQYLESSDSGIGSCRRYGGKI